METTMSHAEAVAYLNRKGIPVRRITRTRVIMGDLTGTRPAIRVPQYTNLTDSQLQTINNLDISTPVGGNPSILDHMKAGRIIPAIKELRNVTRLGLKEAKDIYDHNRETWLRY